jgi:hypothetical protein
MSAAPSVKTTLRRSDECVEAEELLPASPPAVSMMVGMAACEGKIWAHIRGPHLRPVQGRCARGNRRSEGLRHLVLPILMMMMASHVLKGGLCSCDLHHLDEQQHRDPDELHTHEAG